MLVKEDGEWVQALEVVTFTWEARRGPGSSAPDAYSKDFDPEGEY